MNPSDNNNWKTRRHDEMHILLSDQKFQKILVEKVIFSKEPFKRYQNPEWSDFHAWDTKNKTVSRTLLKLEPIVERLEREIPIYLGKYQNFLRGSCDAIISYNIERQKITQYYHIEPILNENGIQKMENDRYMWDIQDLVDEKRDITESCDGCIDIIDEKFERNELYNYYGSSEQIKEDKLSIHVHKPYGLMIELKPTIQSVSGVIGQMKVYKNSLHSRDYDMVLITFAPNIEGFENMLSDEKIHLHRLYDHSAS